MGSYAIEVENVQHIYPDGFEALGGINFRIKPGEFVAIIGQNGAGKTTLIKHLNGLLRPTAGKVLIDGQDIAERKVSFLAKKVGFVFQNPDHQIFKDRVDQEVAFGPLNLGLSQAEIDSRVVDALTAVGLLEHATASPLSLSKGQRQRLALASVLAMKTKVIVLDEPTTGQDYKESLKIMDLTAKLNSEGHTILFITHDMHLVARYARRAIVLCQGKVLLDGAVEEVFTEVEKLNQTFIHPPQITSLALELGLERGILTPLDLLQELKSGGVASGCCS